MMYRSYGTANVTKESMAKVQNRALKSNTLAKEMNSKLGTMTAYFEKKEKEEEVLKAKLWAEEKKRIAASYKPHDKTSSIPSEKVPGGK